MLDVFFPIHACLRAALTCSVLLLALFPVSVSQASHGSAENILPVSKGVYRLPFAAGTTVRINGDHITHSPHNRLDMSPTDNSVAHNVLAAGDGRIEYIQDTFSTVCPTTTSSPTPCNGYDGPSSTCCIRGSPGCTCRNNYVWLRHANGEWSKYTHLRTGSVPNSLSVGDFVSSGTILGLEGDVGRASWSATGSNGIHLHFEVGQPDVVDNALPPGDPNYDPLGIDPANCNVCGFPAVPGDDLIVNNANRQNRIPFFCEFGLPVGGQTYDTVDCDGQCDIDNGVVSGIVADNGPPYHSQTTSELSNDNQDFIVEGGGGGALRAGNVVRLAAGFHAEAGSNFSASIGSCDSPGF